MPRHLEHDATGYDFPGDLSTYERAFRSGWPLTAQDRLEVIRTCQQIIRDPSASPTRRIAACKVLVAADQVNLGLARTKQQERTVDLQSQAAVIRSILSTPRVGSCWRSWPTSPAPNSCPVDSPPPLYRTPHPLPPGGVLPDNCPQGAGRLPLKMRKIWERPAGMTGEGTGEHGVRQGGS